MERGSGLWALAWGSAQAGGSLALGSTAWLVSGLTPSPLLNSLLPVLAALPALLPLARRALPGAALQLGATLLLLAVGLLRLPPVAMATGSAGWALGAALLAVLLFGLGVQMTALPVQSFLVSARRLPMGRLRRGAELGGLLGNLLTGVLFPIGQAVLQFSQALLLLLPLLPLSWLAGRSEPSSTALTAPAAGGRAPGVPLSWRCLLQGLLFGGLFALLPLWVRQEGSGRCLDFGLLLLAYGLGRLLAGSGPGAMAAALARPFRGAPYLLLALLLGATQLLPGWAALLLFLPFGALAGRCDAGLVQTLTHLPGEPLRWQTFERSGAVGGVAGSLGMGLLAQLLGLPLALPLQIAAFVLAAVLLLPPRPAAA